MRIISGTARGTKLYALEGDMTRPTLDRVRESVFNIIQELVRESVFLDLFSGSGAIALEAASRGAKKVVLCDKSKQATTIINKNIEKTHLSNKIDVYNMDFRECLKKCTNEVFDIIYIDPPYETNLVTEAIKEIINMGLLNKNSKIIVETDDEKVLENLSNLKIEIVDKRKYGRVIIAFIKVI